MAFDRWPQWLWGGTEALRTELTALSALSRVPRGTRASWSAGWPECCFLLLVGAVDRLGLRCLRSAAAALLASHGLCIFGTCRRPAGVMTSSSSRSTRMPLTTQQLPYTSNRHGRYTVHGCESYRDTMRPAVLERVPVGSNLPILHNPLSLVCWPGLLGTGWIEMTRPSGQLRLKPVETCAWAMRWALCSV